MLTPLRHVQRHIRALPRGRVVGSRPVKPETKSALEKAYWICAAVVGGLVIVVFIVIFAFDLI